MITRSEALDIIDGRPLLLSISGGKDSTALALLFKELEIPYTSVHCATGWEHSDTNEYLHDYLPEHIGPIEVVRGTDAEAELPGRWEAEARRLEGEHNGGHRSAMIRRILRLGKPPMKRMRWCTEALKIKPFARYVKALDHEPIVGLGIRAEESPRRAAMPPVEYESTYGCDVWRPLLNWSLQDVIDIHQRHGVQPNPLYTRNAERVGCWPCVYSKKAEIKRMASQTPRRIELLEDIERLATERSAERAESGETPGWEPRRRRTWFAVGDVPMPIRKVVQWSRTKRGGRQFELFSAPPSQGGCMRWGLCDFATQGEE